MKSSIFIAALASVLLPFGLCAQEGEPAPFPEFTFKSSKPPKAGSAKRITVQIAPATQAVQTEKPVIAAETTTTTSESQYDWFWETATFDIGQASSASFNRALSVLNSPPSGTVINSPRLGDLKEITDSYGRDILIATIGTQVSPAFVLAVISVESGGKPLAESGKGATGLMQLIPATADRFNVDASIPAQNIQGGVTYLNWLLDKFSGDPILALAGYNAGENAVIAHNGVPPYAETRNYVPKVLAAWKVARGLCMTPPELFSDGCVFVKGS